MHIQRNHSDNETPGQGDKCLVTLLAPIRYRDGIYRYVYGPLWNGNIGSYGSSCSNPVRCVEVGFVSDRGTHVVIPWSNIAAVHPCNKVLKSMDDTLVLENAPANPTP